MEYMKHLNGNPYVIVFAGEKGGVGKSTCALNLAHALNMRTLRVLLVDCDPQWTVVGWNAINDSHSFKVLAGHTDELLNQAIPKFKDHQVVVMDVAGKMSSLNSLIIKNADLVIMPTTPYAESIHGNANFVDVIKLQQMSTPGRPSACFLTNLVMKGTILGKSAASSLSAQDFGFPILKASLSQYILYPTAYQKGESIFDSGESQPVHEFNTLTEEIIATYISRAA